MSESMTGFGCCLQTALFPSPRARGRFCFACVCACVCVRVCVYVCVWWMCLAHCVYCSVTPLLEDLSHLLEIQVALGGTAQVAESPLSLGQPLPGGLHPMTDPCGVGNEVLISEQSFLSSGFPHGSFLVGWLPPG